MPKELSPKKALDRAQWLCSQSERCKSDVAQKLAQWGVVTEERQSIIDSLVRDGFVDESRYATTFARDKARFNKWGPKKIEMALRVKRVPDIHIQNALTDIVPLINTDILAELITKKIKTLKYKDNYDLKNKLLRFGISRGFSYGDVLPVVEAVIQNEIG